METKYTILVSWVEIYEDDQSRQVFPRPHRRLLGHNSAPCPGMFGGRHNRRPAATTFYRNHEAPGLPDYVMTIIGVWYLLGGVALLMPRFPRLKEWAYAGLFFIYTGAIASRLAVGDSVVTFMGPIILTGLVIASWALRPSTRSLNHNI